MALVGCAVHRPPLSSQSPASAQLQQAAMGRNSEKSSLQKAITSHCRISTILFLSSRRQRLRKFSNALPLIKLGKRRSLKQPRSRGGYQLAAVYCQHTKNDKDLFNVPGDLLEAASGSTVTTCGKDDQEWQLLRLIILTRRHTFAVINDGLASATRCTMPVCLEDN